MKTMIVKMFNENLKTLFIAIFLMISIGAFAQNIDTDASVYLYTKSEKSAEVYSADEIRKITFSNNGVRVWNTNWPTEYAYSNFRSIAFNQKNGTIDTGVETVRQEDVGIIINYVASSQRLIVTSPTLLSGVEVYTMDGMLVASDRQQANVCTMSLSDISQGVYIVKAHSNKGVTTKKIVR